MTWWLGFGCGVICLAVALAVVGFVVARRPTDRQIADLIDDERIAGHLRADAQSLREQTRHYIDKRGLWPW